MGRIAHLSNVLYLKNTVLILLLLNLAGCPIKDWVKRDDAFLTVEQYKLMTEVISINDTLYRVKKGEEINQNKITAVFVNLQQYINTPRKEQNKAFRAIRQAYRSDSNTFNALTYALVLLERKGNEARALKILSGIGRHGISAEEKDLVNLAHILHSVLKAEARSKRQYTKLRQAHELIKEEVSYLNKQINALKSIEESIHSREVSVK